MTFLIYKLVFLQVIVDRANNSSDSTTTVGELNNLVLKETALINRVRTGVGRYTLAGRL